MSNDNLPVEDKDFKVVNVDDDALGFQFAGFTVTFGNVSIKDREDGSGESILNFTYDVVEGDENEFTEEHEQRLGEILEKILLEEFGDLNDSKGE